MQKVKNIELRVGLFVTAALLVAGVLVFVIGQRGNLFESKVRYHVLFTSVGGLAAGSPVRVGGVSVGNVSEVELSDKGKILVHLKVVNRAQKLVREGSRASLGNKGLLGDRIVEITIGTGKSLPNDSWIPGDETVDLSSYVKKAGSILHEVEQTAENLRLATEPLGTQEFGKDIRSATHNLSSMLKAAQTDNSALGKLISDPQTARQMDSTLSNVNILTQKLIHTVETLHAVGEEIQKGNGSAHELIYGDSGAKLTANLADATGEVALLLRAIRTGEGTLHDLIYEDKATALVDNLTAVSENVRFITDELRAGRGTLGALLTDPSVYEDLKRLVGDLERNEVLRALVRYSIRRDETQRNAVVSSPKKQ